MGTAATLVPDRLWDLIEPLLPSPITRPQGGRPRLSDRACLTGIVFVLSQWHPLEHAPERARLRLGYELLAATARLAAGRSLGSASLAEHAFAHEPD